MQRFEDQHRQLELYALRRAQPVKAGERKMVNGFRYYRALESVSI